MATEVEGLTIEVDRIEREKKEGEKRVNEAFMENERLAQEVVRKEDRIQELQQQLRNNARRIVIRNTATVRGTFYGGASVASKIDSIPETPITDRPTKGGADLSASYGGGGTLNLKGRTDTVHELRRRAQVRSVNQADGEREAML